MTNLFAWIAILAALYWFMPSFRRMVNGWIVQLGDKVKHDADLPHKPEPITEQQVEDAAGLMFRMDFPNNPDIEKGFDGTPAGVKEAYMGRARAYLSGEDMDEYAEKSDGPPPELTTRPSIRRTTIPRRDSGASASSASSRAGVPASRYRRECQHARDRSRSEGGPGGRGPRLRGGRRDVGR